MIINGRLFKWRTMRPGPNVMDKIFELCLHENWTISPIAIVRPIFKGHYVIMGYIIEVNYDDINWSDSIDFDKNHKQTLKHAFSIAERFIETKIDLNKCLER